MNIISITEENKGLFADFIDEDMAENIGRIFYRGIAALDEEKISGAMIWEVLNLESRSDTESAIRFFRAKDPLTVSLLLKAYDKMIRSEDVKLSTVVLPVKDNREEKELLKKAGFSMMLTESDHIILSLSKLKELSIMKSRAVPGSIVTLYDVTIGEFRKGILKCKKIGKKGLCEDLEYLDESFFEENVSCCNLKDGDIDSFLLFHRLPSGMLSVQLMICMDNEDASAILVGMMRKFVISMEEEYTDDTKVLLNRHNQASLLLSEKLFPRNIGIPVYSGSRKEA